MSSDGYPHDLFLGRIWELRHNLTAYDAAYVALAESLDAVLLTADERLGQAKGRRAVVETIEGATRAEERPGTSRRRASSTAGDGT